MTYSSRQRLIRVAESIATKGDPTRRRCFIAHHSVDDEEVADFVESFGDAFIPRVVGVSDEDDYIDSDDTDYVMDRIRDKYLRDSTVTIVIIGGCTWARRFVDWEVYSSLRNDAKNRRSGLMAITLPSMADSTRHLPPRVADNVDGEKGYARWWKYPSSASDLRDLIETAFEARTSKAHLSNNTRERKLRNSSCP